MKRLLTTSAAALLFLAGCDGCGGPGGQTVPVTAGGDPATPSEATPAPDPMKDELVAIADRATRLPPAVDGGVVPERESFRRDALLLGNRALEERRMDLVVGAAEALRRAGEIDGAAAFLQRAGGLTAKESVGNEHQRALARLKVQQGRALEAASLLERLIDGESPAAGDFAMLSWAYLAAGRPGPARAAVTRGQRVHPQAEALKVQAAEVKLVSDGPEAALAALDGLTGEQALRLVAEAKLVSGDSAGARAAASSLVSEHPDSPWGPLLLAAIGGPGTDDKLGEARDLAARSLDGSDALRALGWAAAAEHSSPWEREVPRPPEPDNADKPGTADKAE